MSDSAQAVQVREKVRALVAQQPSPDRTHLLEVLHGVQHAFQEVSRVAAEEIERCMGVPVADVYGLVTFYDLLSTRPTGRRVLRICEDATCYLHGADALAAEAERVIGPQGQPRADGSLSWERCACLGLCDRAPAALDGEQQIAPLRAQDVRRIGEAHD